MVEAAAAAAAARAMVVAALVVKPSGLVTSLGSTSAGVPSSFSWRRLTNQRKAGIDQEGREAANQIDTGRQA